MPTEICRGERLSEIGKPGAAGDERYLAEALAYQIEYATALVVPTPCRPRYPRPTTPTSSSAGKYFGTSSR